MTVAKVIKLQPHLGEFIVTACRSWHLETSPFLSPRLTDFPLSLPKSHAGSRSSLSISGCKAPVCQLTSTVCLAGLYFLDWAQSLLQQVSSAWLPAQDAHPYLLLPPVIHFLMGQPMLTPLIAHHDPKWNHCSHSSLHLLPLPVPICWLSCLPCNHQIPFPKPTFTYDSFVCRKPRLQENMKLYKSPTTPNLWKYQIQWLLSLA